MRSAVTARFAYKVAALTIAIAIWLTVYAEEPVDARVSVQFSVIVEGGRRLADQPPPIHVVLSGRGREILKLYHHPPTVRRVFGSETGDSALVALRPADVELPAGAEIIVRHVEPPAFVLHLTRGPGS
jgi:hypothetical protein